MADMNVGHLTVQVGVDTSQLQQAPGVIAAAMAHAGSAGATAATQAGTQTANAFTGAFGSSATAGITTGATQGLNAVAGHAASAGHQAGAHMGAGIAPGVTQGVQHGLQGGTSAAGQAGTQAGGRFSTMFASIAGSAIGNALGSHLGDIFNQAKGFIFGAQDASAKLTAQLGLSADEAKRFGDDAKDLFGNNFAGSLDEANDAIKNVVLNIGGMRTASSTDLQSITGQVSELATAFDQDLGPITIAVGQMMKTGLATNAQQALDIITVGFQKGADKADDFLDTLNEYGVQFQKLGIDGTTATGLLSQGLQAGARDADLVADAMKEFSIRAVDGSTTTIAGFTALGLNAKATGEAVAHGGKTARDATEQVLTSLAKVEDPAKRAAIATELFGTQSEDLGKALFKLDLNSAATGMGNVAGAAQKVSDGLGGTASATITTFWQTLQKTGMTIANDLLPVVTPLIQGLGQVTGIIAKVAGAFETLPGPLQTGIVAMTGLALIGPKIAGVARSLFNEFRNLGTGAGAASGGLSKLGKMLAGGAIFAGAAFIIGQISDSMARVKAVQDDLSGSVKTVSDSLVEQGGKWNDVTKAALTASVTGSDNFQNLINKGANYGDVMDLVTGKTNNVAKVLSEIDKAGGFKGASPDDITSIYRYVGGLSQIAPKAATNAAAVSDYNAKQAAAAAAMKAAQSGQDAQTSSLTKQAEAWYASAHAASTAQKTIGLGDEQRAIGLQKVADASVSSALAEHNMADSWTASEKASNAATLSAAAYAMGLANLKAAPAKDMAAMAASITGVSDAAQKADTMVSAFGIAIDKLTGRNVPLEEATANLNGQILALATSLGSADDRAKINFKTLVDGTGTINTASDAGQKLYASVNSYAEAYDTSVTAAVTAAGAHATVTQKVGAAQKAADSARQSFIKQAEGLGLSTTQAQKLADHMGILEGKKITPKTLHLTAQDEASKKLAELEAKKLSDKKILITAGISNDIESVASSIQSAIQGFFNNHPAVVPVRTASTGIPQARATGGRVFGPGTGTSDSIPALLSNGEGVNTAAAMSKPANVAAMHFMNSGGTIPGFKSGGIAGFASGGMVTAGQLAGNADPSYGDRQGRVVTALQSIAEVVAGARDAIADAVSKSSDAKGKLDEAKASQKTKVADALATRKAKEADAAAAVRNAKTADARKAAQAREAKVRKDQDAAVAKVKAAQAAQVKAAQVISNNAQLAETAARRNAASAAAAQKSEQKRYQTLSATAARFDAITDKLATAKDALGTARSDKASAVAGYASSIAGYDGGITGHSDVRTTAGSIINGLRFNLSKINTFKADITKLRKEGMSAQLLNQLTGDFGSGGEDAAHALASGSLADVRAVNSLQAQINSSSLGAASVAPSAQFDGGIAKLQAGYNSLLKLQAETNTQLQAYAGSIDKKLVGALSGWTVSFDDRGVGHLMAPHMKAALTKAKVKASQR